jgi:ATP-dependent helicase/nuclease subunit A
MNFNGQQTLAITKRGGNIQNILVSAGAGSGKTAVLTERVVKLVTATDNSINIDNLLIMTFTKNAAAEMRERIAKELKKRLAEFRESFGADNAVTENCLKQLSLLNRAHITTIDSFCNTIVRQYFYKLDIDPTYRIAGNEDCQELTQLSNEVMDTLFELKYTEQDKDFLQLVEYFCPADYNDDRLRLVLRTIQKVLSSQPNSDRWFETSIDLYRTDGEAIGNGLQKMLSNYILENCTLCENILKKAEGIIKNIYSLCQDFLEENKYNVQFCMYADNFRIFRQAFDACNGGNYNDMYNVFQKKLTSLTKGKKTNLPEDMDIAAKEIKPLYNDFKELLWNKGQKLISSYSPEYVTAALKSHKHITESLFALYKEYQALYMQKKVEQSVFSFSDINHYCVKILLKDDGSPTDEALKYRDKFAEIIVDEYQDNNYLQECILNALSYKKNNLFMVGDVKQSIYKFRLACPEIFAQKYKSYNKDNLDSGNICIRLSENYRSRREVLSTANFLFYQLMRDDIGGVAYNIPDALKLGADYYPDYDTRNELLIYDKSGKADSKALQALDGNEIEAHIIAQKICKLIDPANPTMVYDKVEKCMRPCTLSDITILMSAPNKCSKNYISIMGQYGISAVARSTYSLYGTLEVKTMMAMLKVMDNPYRDKELVTVLHSPMFCVDCNELTIIKLIDKSKPLYDNIDTYINTVTDTGELKAKLLRFKDVEEQIHTLKGNVPFNEVMNTIYRLTDYLNYLSLIKNSASRLNNLRMLEEQANEIYNMGIIDFGGIVNELTKIEREVKEVDGNITSEYDDTVKILSIHNSKGLQFPIVFVSQIGNQLFSSSDKAPIIASADNGIAFDDLNLETRLKSSFIVGDLIKTLDNDILRAEKLRLLYVALTRAEEKLILVASASTASKTVLQRWTQYSDYTEEGFSLPVTAIKSATSYLDWIMMAYNRRIVLNNALLANGEPTIDIEKLLQIKTITPDEVNMDEKDLSIIRERYLAITQQEPENTELQILNDRLLECYMDKAAVTLPSKISISEIKRQHRLNEYNQLISDISSYDVPSGEAILEKLTQNKAKETTVSFDPPEFLTAEKTVLDGAQRGTAYHAVFEHLTLNPSATLKDIQAQLKSMLDKSIISEAEYNSVEANKFLAFLQSDLGKRICNADNVYRETPFVMRMSPDKIYSEDYSDTRAEILVHGIVDLYFEKSGEIVLVDYKTDKVTKQQTVENICERYRIQLDFYKQAIEKSTSMPVKEMYLYLIDINKFVKL